MAKKNNKVVSKPKTTKEIPTPKEEVIIETVTQEETDPKKNVNVTNINGNNMLGTTKSSLDANHRVELIGLANDVFRKDPDAVRRYGTETVEVMNEIIAAGIISSIADEAMFGETTFSAVLKHQLYPQLVVTAKNMGIKLPDIKSLPVDKEGNVKIEKEQIKINKEAKETLKKEKEIEEEKPELDPVKVANMDDEALRKALEYILITGPKTSRVKDTLVKTVDFMRTYAMTIADKAENAAEAKLKYDDYTTGQWLEMAFSHVKPTFLFNGIGRGLVSTIGLEKAPVTAFCIMRKSMTKDDGTVEWDDQSIADATKAIVKLVATNCIEKEQKDLDALDEKAKDYNSVKEKYQSSISHYQDIIDYLEHPDGGIIPNLIDGVESGDPVLEKIYTRVQDRYYPNKKRENYKNLDNNVKTRIGLILNMFKEAGTEDMNYNESDLTELVMYSEEELAEIKKQKLEESEEETKND